MITSYIKGLFTVTFNFVFLCSFISLNLSNLSIALKFAEKDAFAIFG